MTEAGIQRNENGPVARSAGVRWGTRRVSRESAGRGRFATGSRARRFPLSRDLELDIAFAFPAFFDYPAEYLGREMVDGAESDKLAVTLPLGVRMTYFVDTEHGLPGPRGDRTAV